MVFKVRLSPAPDAARKGRGAGLVRPDNVTVTQTANAAEHGLACAGRRAS